ncbi:hypothetical protein HDU83_009196 [Entophlyctis luteolus]|nr:hypothetical protein HDU83_009196 [Entophlyctis luteolus]
MDAPLSSLELLPIELRHGIALHLPIDNTLVSAVMCSVSAFRFLLTDFVFAHRHLGFAEIHQTRILAVKHWKRLPLVYRAASMAFAAFWALERNLWLQPLRQTSSIYKSPIAIVLCSASSIDIGRFGNSFILNWVAWHGRDDLLVKILNHHSHTLDVAGTTSALSLAVRHAGASTVRILLSPEETNHIYPRPHIDESTMRHALARNNQEIITMLVEDPACDPSLDNYGAFRWAAASHDALASMELIDSLLSHPKVNPSKAGTAMFAAACCNGNAWAVLLGFELNPSMVQPVKTGFKLACTNTQPHIVELILQHARMSILVDGVEEFGLACMAGNIKIAKVLLENISNANVFVANECAAIRFACQRGHADLLDALLEHPRITLSSRKKLVLTLAATQNTYSEAIMSILKKRGAVFFLRNVKSL